MAEPLLADDASHVLIEHSSTFLPTPGPCNPKRRRRHPLTLSGPGGPVGPAGPAAGQRYGDASAHLHRLAAGSQAQFLDLPSRSMRALFGAQLCSAALHCWY